MHEALSMLVIRLGANGGFLCRMGNPKSGRTFNI